MLWKIYFWVMALGYATYLPTILTNLSKQSLGDWLINVGTALSIIALYSYAFGINVLNKKYWKIIFFVNLVLVVFFYLYFLTDFNLFAGIFEAKYLIMTSSYGPIWNVAYAVFSEALSLPLYYAMFYVAFRNLKHRQQYLKAESSVVPSKHAHNSKLAITSLVTGIVGFILGPLFSIISLVTGAMAMQSIVKAKGKQKGKNFAVAGVIMSIVQIFLFAILMMVAAQFVQTPGLLNGYENAVKALNQDELAFYHNRLEKISEKTTEEDVVTMLGKPDTKSASENYASYQYACPATASPACTLVITFLDKKVSSVTWMDFPRFVYTRMYTQEK